MHMVLPRAIADVRNQTYHLTRAFASRLPQRSDGAGPTPRAGFCVAAHTVDGIDSLRGLDNGHFLRYVGRLRTGETFSRRQFQAFGTTRLMYGSDFFVSEMRGRAISINDGFFWLYR